LGKAGGYILKLSEDRYSVFEKRSIIGSDIFAEPVQDFQHSRTAPLICFVLSPSKTITRIARGRRGFKAGTALRRLNIENIKDLSQPIPAATVINNIPIKVKKRAISCFENGGLLAPKSFEAVIDAIRKLSPETRPILDLYSRERRELIRRLSEKTRHVLSYQKEAVATALKIAGLPRETLQQWTPSTVAEPTSFLEGLHETRLREDTMVITDFMNLPGYDLIKTMPYNAAIFEDESTRMTVILANRQPLEELLGTDLIYYNETYQSFVMVQYKAMEKEKNDVCFRLPDEQLTKEISRMNDVLEELHKYTSTNNCKGFRLNDNPFFIKLCSRILFNPDEVSLFPGMYIPLDYWRLLENDPIIKGQRGGRRIIYDNTGRYFTNTEFTSLVTKAWVGTTIKQSTVLERAIHQTLESGKAVAVAIKFDKPDPNDIGLSQAAQIQHEQDINEHVKVQQKLW